MNHPREHDCLSCATKYPCSIESSDEDDYKLVYCGECGADICYATRELTPGDDAQIPDSAPPSGVLRSFVSSCADSHESVDRWQFWWEDPNKYAVWIDGGWCGPRKFTESAKHIKQRL